MGRPMAAGTSGLLRIVCLALATLSTALSAAIVGTASHTYHVYQVQSAAENPWWLPLWPQHFDTAGTKSLIGAGVGVILLNLTYLVVSVIPKLKFSTRTLLSVATALVLSVASGLLACFSVILGAVLNGHTRNSDTIQTWTCRFSKTLPGVAIVGIDRNQSNEQFATLCEESRFGFWAMVAVIILQFLLFASAIAQWFTRRRSSAPDESHRKGSEDGYSF